MSIERQGAMVINNNNNNPYARSNQNHHDSTAAAAAAAAAAGSNHIRQPPPYGMNTYNNNNGIPNTNNNPNSIPLGRPSSFPEQQQQQQQHNNQHAPQYQQQHEVASTAVPPQPIGADTTHQQQPQQPQELINALRKQLEEKDEENFDLSASLSAVQVETNHRIGQVELDSKQKISKLEEALRRAQQDANRARSALKKQQQQQPLVVQQQPQTRQIPPAVITAPVADSLQHTRQAVHPPIEGARNGGSVSPSPGDAARRKGPSSPFHQYAKAPAAAAVGEPMEIDATHTILPQPNSVPSTLARRLLESMATLILPQEPAVAIDGSRRYHEENQVRVFLTQQLTTMTPTHYNSDPTTSSNHAIIWGLVQQSVDYDNHTALTVLHWALLWSSPRACQMLLQAAGMGEENSQSRNNDGTAAVSTIRLCNSTKNQRRGHQLEAIAACLKHPLALSSSSPVALLPSQLESEKHQPFFSPKQKVLARQLVAKLSEEIWNPPVSKTNTTDTASGMVHNTTIANTQSPLPPTDTNAIRILTQLLSSAHSPTSVSSIKFQHELLELAMVNTVLRLEAHKEQQQHKQQQHEIVARKYDPLSSKHYPQGEVDDDSGGEDPIMIDEDDDKASNKSNRKSKDNTNRQGLGGDDIDNLHLGDLHPMLIELCCQFGRLFPDSDATTNRNESSPKQDPIQEFVYQWRKAVLANACDMLEDVLLPLLLKLGSQEDSNHMNDEQGDQPATNTTPALDPPPTAMAVWRQWIPFFTGLIRHSPGRHLLRIQFPLDVKAVASAHLVSEGGTAINDNDSTMVVPNSTAQGSLSCSSIGFIVQLLYASVMIEQTQERRVSREILTLCQTLRDQSIRFLHAWLQSHESRHQHAEITFLELLSEGVDYYKSACAWILHQSTAAAVATNESEGIPDAGISRRVRTIDPEIVAMIRIQQEELMLDEDDAREEREERYGSI